MTDNRLWYIAHTKTCREKKAAEILGSLGVEHYVAIRSEIHKWSDRKKLVERVMLPHMIFIRCLPGERIPLLTENPHLSCYMSVKGTGKPAVVKDSEMETFRAMVEYGGRRLNVSMAEFAPGDRVRVTSGPLSGKECELVSIEGEKYLVVRLSVLGAATVKIDKETVEKIV